jgi:hypothetical protein
MDTDLVAPAATVMGKVNPVAKNTPPEKFDAVTVTDPVPVLESVTPKLDAFPSKTLPNDKVFGETLRSCVTVAETLTVADALFVGSATLVAVTL